MLVAVSREGANCRIVGIAQVAPTDDIEDCEFALVVADDLQGQGLGMRLMDALIDAARAAGYREVVGDVLTDNRAMLALAPSRFRNQVKQGSDADADRPSRGKSVERTRPWAIPASGRTRGDCRVSLGGA